MEGVSSSSVCDDVVGVDDATNNADGDCLTDTTARLDADGGENAAARLRCRAIVRACLPLLLVELDAMISLLWVVLWLRRTEELDEGATSINFWDKPPPLIVLSLLIRCKLHLSIKFESSSTCKQVRNGENS